MPSYRNPVSGRYSYRPPRTFSYKVAAANVGAALGAGYGYLSSTNSSLAKSRNQMVSYSRKRSRKLRPPSYGRKRARTSRRRTVKKRKISKRKPDRLLSMRIGNISATGGKTVNQNKRYIDDLCATCFGVTGTTAGDSLAWDVNNYNDPLTDKATVGTLTELGTTKNHPAMHDDALVGYDQARIISSSYRIFIKNTAGNRDFIVAWTFSDNNTTPLTWTAGTVTIDNWKDIQGSRGWQWKRFSSLGGGNPGVPSSGYIYIRIPSVFKLIRGIYNKGLSTNNAVDMLTKPSQLSAVISDSNVGGIINIYLHLIVFNPEGTALTANQLVMEVQWRGKVELLRSRDATTIVDEADQFA